MKTIAIDQTFTKPENLEFFRVISFKLDDRTDKSILFGDVLFCEKTKNLEKGHLYVFTSKHGNKVGFMGKTQEDGFFELISAVKNKELFPDYKLKISDFDELYRCISFSRDFENFNVEYSEDWDDFDEVKLWEPETHEDFLTFQSNISNYQI